MIQDQDEKNWQHQMKRGEGRGASKEGKREKSPAPY